MDTSDNLSLLFSGSVHFRDAKVDSTPSCCCTVLVGCFTSEMYWNLEATRGKFDG